MAISDAFRDAMLALDIRAARRLWLPFAGASDEQVLIVLHHARTQAESFGLRDRAFSHRWLLERGLPSGLPDKLRPAAERLCPKRVGAVGIAFKNVTGRISAEQLREAERAMADGAAELYAAGVDAPERVRPRLIELRDRVLRH